MNGWISAYTERINKLNYVLEESLHRGSFDTQLDLNEIKSLFSGAIAEIRNLQNQVDVLKVALNQEKAKAKSE